ncbi:MAG: hypothetical protein WC958_02110 [Dehalococcoidales bacterium]
MKNKLIKFWIVLTVTPVTAALVLRLIWAAQIAYAIGTWIIIVLLISAAVALYAALLYFIFNPDAINKLKTLPSKIFFSVVLIALIIVSVIHFYRFVPSPEANLSISIPMAIMILISELSGGSLMLYLIWKK